MVHHLLPLNIRLLFVFDGPNRPGKNGKKPAGEMRPEDAKLLKQMLEVLAVPYVVAPAEAEAECAKLQMQGIVDAVWSEDSDCLMFGCTFLIKDHRVPKVRSKGKPEQIRRPDSNHVGDTERSMTHVRVYKAAYLKENFGLERHDFLLAALLSGNDYDNHKGIKGCSMRIAMDAAKAGYGSSLWDSSTRLSEWRRGGIAGFLAKQHGNIDFPLTFPDQMVFRHCRWPKTTSEMEMSRVRQLVSSDMPINEIDLQKFMGPMFNLWAEYYLQRITPIFLVRTLAQTQPGQEKSNSSFEVQRVFSRGQELHGASTSKVRFVPRYLTTIDLNYNRDGSPSDPELLRECTTLNAILINGLGKQFLEKPPTSSRKGLKRQLNEASLSSEQPASKHPRLLNPTPKKVLLSPTLKSQIAVLGSTIWGATRPGPISSMHDDKATGSLLSSSPYQKLLDQKTPIVRRDQAHSLAPVTPTSHTMRQPAQTFRMPVFDLFDIDDFRDQGFQPHISLSTDRHDSKISKNMSNESRNAAKPSSTSKPLNRFEIAETRLKRYSSVPDGAIWLERPSTACIQAREPVGSLGESVISSQLAGQTIDLTDA